MSVLHVCIFSAPTHLLHNGHISRSLFVPPPLFGPRYGPTIDNQGPKHRPNMDPK
jgi:hypothetical protein